VKRRSWYGLAFVSPGILYFAVFFVYPVLSALSWSLTNYDLVSAPKFVGLDNFRYMATDTHFLNGLSITLRYVAGVVPAVFVCGFLLALLFNQSFAGRAIFRAIFFAPFIVSLVAASFIWRYVYQPTYGLYPQLASLLHLPQINWLNDGRYAIWGLVIIGGSGACPATTCWSSSPGCRTSPRTTTKPPRSTVRARSHGSAISRCR
jgi:multiple sugar transport system permease protein